MSAAGYVFRVDSLEASNFTEALAQNVASAMNNLAMSKPISNRFCFIRAISIVTKENYGPELNFFSSATAFTVDPATDKFLSRFGFLAGMGIQLGGSGLWRYYTDGLAIPYVDEDSLATANTSFLHVVLQNISATAKSAGAAGNTQVSVWLEPMSGW